jgi:hypothetical protein
MTRTLAALAVVTTLLGSPAATRADVVEEWNAILLDTLAGQNPFAQARFAAITHLAVFEAVNAIEARYEPYLGTIGAPPGASPDAAAVAAAHMVLKQYFPARAATLDAARASSLAALPDGAAKEDGIAVGEAAAAAFIALRASDGAAPPQFYAPIETTPGLWQATPGCPPAGGILFHWQNVTPFALKNSSQFRSGPPPPLKSHKYAKDYAEVKSVGAADSVLRPADRADVAQFYNVVLAVGVWNRVAQQLAAADPGSLSRNARVFALLNMVISDALVTVMETKYYYALWRPVTAIPAADTDSNPRTAPDALFTPFIPTPCFPSYPSAHASASYAARAVLQRFWGNGGHDIVLSHASLPQVLLQYPTLKAITDDIDDARVYGGIHFRFDQEAGARQGRQIGRDVLQYWLERRKP